ncbi:MAG: hypothetical protein Q9222_007302 [Ikaeria aurantiellina]
MKMESDSSMTDGDPVTIGDQKPTASIASSTASSHPSLKLLIIGAGARGNAYARAVTESTNACIYAVADPIQQKRDALGSKYIWKDTKPAEGQSFGDWKEFLRYEKSRRDKQNAEEAVEPGVNGVFVCTLDTMHAGIIMELAPLGLHIMSEKPLATSLRDCVEIWRKLQPTYEPSPRAVFSVGHVLHYSPHNMLLKKLLLEDFVIAPSGSGNAPHLPVRIASMGSLKYFKRSRKPNLAGYATNCLSCPAEPECIYSAKKIYQDKFLASGNAGWPIHIIDPEIEDLVGKKGMGWATGRFNERLAEDYSSNTPGNEIPSRPWFGRCVYECDNDVCDDQTVMIEWEDNPPPRSEHLAMVERLRGRGAKTATFHMIAQTERQCERRGRVYGSKGEIEYDSKMIRVFDFATSKAKVHHPHQAGGGHGGGDEGLTQHFVHAIEAVEEGRMTVEQAQKDYIGCTLEDVVRSHAIVFAAEEARKGKKIVSWADWWYTKVERGY